MSAVAAPMTVLSDLVPICSHLPAANVDQLIGAARRLSHAGGRASRKKLAGMLRLDDEHAVGVIQFLSRVGLIDTEGGEIVLTAVGHRIAASTIAERRRLFAELALERFPVIREIVETLTGEPKRSLPRLELLMALGAQSCAADADRVFDHVVAWGRYGGLFSYDAKTGDVTLL